MNDSISRQAAIDAINHICPVDTEYDCTLLDRVDVRYVLSDLPSAQPERKKGEWIYQTKFGRIECEACGYVFRSYVYPRNFCPNCGADMRGDKA